MTLLVVAALRSVLAASIALALWALTGHRSAAFRHWVLAAGIGATAAVVPLSFVLPQWEILPSAERIMRGAPETMTSIEVVETAVPAEASSQALAPWYRRMAQVPTVAILWSAGALAGLCLLAVRLGRLAHLTSRARSMDEGPWRTMADETARMYQIARPIDLRCTSAPDIVATWGVRKPVVLVPASAASWDPSWVRVVLHHELAHIRRRDWALQMVSETIRALLWFNPALWALCSRLRRESECACDDLVLRSGVPVDTYASHLVDIARACRGASTPLPALPVAGPSTLERRVTMLLKTDRDRRLPTRWAGSLILVGMLLVGGTLASVGVFAQSTPGRLVGYVYDTSGAVLPGVEVVLESAQLAKWPTTTDSSGRFEFTPVGAGKYTLSVSVPGFRTLRDQFELGSASNWNRSITMQVGELQETITVTARRPNPRPATAASTEPVRVGGNIKPPRKIINAAPVYPPSMRDAGLEGVVPMEALIAVDGTVSSVRVLSAQVHPEFARAAEDAVRQWRFSQTLLNGVPVEVQMTVTVQFGLTD